MKTIKVNIFFEDIEQGLNYELISTIVNKIFTSEGKTPEDIEYEVNIIFINSEYMKELNQRFKGKDATTDVLAFNYDITESENLFGEVYIDAEYAKSQASIYGTMYLDELKLYLIHGCLHILGYRDNTDESRLVMRAKEQEYLSLFSNTNSQTGGEL